MMIGQLMLALFYELQAVMFLSLAGYLGWQVIRNHYRRQAYRPLVAGLAAMCLGKGIDALYCGYTRIELCLAPEAALGVEALSSPVWYGAGGIALAGVSVFYWTFRGVSPLWKGGESE